MDKTCLIKSNEEFGRYVVAAKNIKAGEILFEETPFAYGPKADSPVVCLGCYNRLNGKASDENRCSKCGWPLCSTCTDHPVHAKECELFSVNKVKFQNSEHITHRCTQLDCITPLRVLMAIESNSERWKCEIEIMEDHKEERFNSETWNNDDNNIVKYLHGPCKLSDKFSADLIQQVIGILEVNAFEAKTSNNNSVRCLYPKLAILAHSCTPNTAHSCFPSDSFKVIVRATISVNEGDMLNSCYTHTLCGTRDRQYHLTNGKYFTCRCKRCLDPTELNSHLSSFKCSKCDSGLIISTDPLNNEAEWKCTNCEFSTCGTAIAKAVNVMQSEIEAVASEFEPGAERLQKYEQLFKKYSSVLHPNHFIQIGLRQSLIELYGRVDGYELDDLPDDLLEHKCELIRSFLKILDIVEPGMTRIRAQMLFELHAPLLYIFKSGFSSNTLSGSELKNQIGEIINCLDTCANILEWEDPTTPEGVLCGVSKNASRQMNASLSALTE